MTLAQALIAALDDDTSATVIGDKLIFSCPGDAPSLDLDKLEAALAEQARTTQARLLGSRADRLGHAAIVLRLHDALGMRRMNMNTNIDLNEVIGSARHALAMSGLIEYDAEKGCFKPNTDLYPNTHGQAFADAYNTLADIHHDPVGFALKLIETHGDSEDAALFKMFWGGR